MTELIHTLMVGFLLFACVFLFWLWFCFGNFMKRRQKTRSPQQRRGGMYMGSRARPSLGPHEPTIYVSPSNLPPPPKYECMAPPSYEEVVGIHYPNYQPQPITQPLTTALATAHTSQPSTAALANDTGPSSTDTRPSGAPPTVVVTVNERPAVNSS